MAHGTYIRIDAQVDAVCDDCQNNGKLDSYAFKHYPENDGFWEHWEDMGLDLGECVCCGVDVHA